MNALPLCLEQAWPCTGSADVSARHRSLEELYLTGHQCADAHGPDMSALWPVAQHLRVLVLDVLQDMDHMASPLSALLLCASTMCCIVRSAVESWMLYSRVCYTTAC